MTPDQSQLVRDLDATPFIEGAVRNRWRLVKTSWPTAVFAVRARDDKVFGFCFDLAGYPQNPPTARLWNLERDAPPDPNEWPKGSAAFISVFNPSWKQGTALYHPFDRVSREGHGDWPKQYPHLIWNPYAGVVQYLAEIHRLLNGRGYHGIS